MFVGKRMPCVGMERRPEIADAARNDADAWRPGLDAVAPRPALAVERALIGARPREQLPITSSAAQAGGTEMCCRIRPGTVRGMDR